MTTQQKIAQLEKELAELKEKLKREQKKQEWIQIPELNIEVEKEAKKKGLSYDDYVKFNPHQQDSLDKHIKCKYGEDCFLCEGCMSDILKMIDNNKEEERKRILKWIKVIQVELEELKDKIQEEKK